MKHTHGCVHTLCSSVKAERKTEGLRKKGGEGNKRLKEESHAESALCIRYLLGLCRASADRNGLLSLFTHQSNQHTTSFMCVLEWIWLRVSFCVFYNVACEWPYGDVMMIKAVMVADGRHSHINSAPEFNALQRLSLAMFGMKYCLLNCVRVLIFLSYVKRHASVIFAFASAPVWC